MLMAAPSSEFLVSVQLEQAETWLVTPIQPFEPLPRRFRTHYVDRIEDDRILD